MAQVNNDEKEKFKESVTKQANLIDADIRKLIVLRANAP